MTMELGDKVVVKSGLFIFLSLVIMNSIKFIPLITVIGSIGKLVFCAVFIIFVFLFIKRSIFKIKFLEKLSFFGIGFLIVGFSIIFYLKNGSSENLLANCVLPIYIYFYYLVCKLLLRLNADNPFPQSSKFDILSIFRLTLFSHLCIWFPVAFLMGVNMFEIDGAFGGFFQDEIHFGLYMVTGFLVCFYLRFNGSKKDRSLLNLCQMLIFLVGVMFASRNAFLIVVTVITFFFAVSKFKRKLYIFPIVLLPLLVVNIDVIISGFSIEKLNEISSGRYFIWQLAITSMVEDGYLIGKGLFNLNGLVLKSNVGTGIYYFDDLDTLSFHSSYIELFAGGGILAIFLFFRLVVRTWSRCNAMDKSIILGILIGALFESYLIQPFMLIPCLFYFIVIINNIESHLNQGVKTSNLVNIAYAKD